jgi:3'-phosphoadenosine 5'-phosphosulfate sulfotransferase (PAPS reductase)/FAD synthetase
MSRCSVVQLRLFDRDPIPAAVVDLIARGALFVANHSGGKDSQAMLIELRKIVPADQILVIHAELPDVEWEGTQAHIRATIDGLPLIVARAKRTFWEMVEARGKFPSPQQRQCTSDLKRGPIQREIRRYLKANPRFGGLVVNCMGMRAGESAKRAKLTAFRRSDANSKAGREWFDWLPIHDFTEAEVFGAIRSAGQEPHWVYAAGMTRKSCQFCIMASEQDLTTAARLAPESYRRYVAAERRLNFTLTMSGRTLPEITGIAA